MDVKISEIKVGATVIIDIFEIYPPAPLWFNFAGCKIKPNKVYRILKKDPTLSAAYFIEDCTFSLHKRFFIRVPDWYLTITDPGEREQIRKLLDI